MKYLLLILSMSILLSGELEVDGDLKVTGTIQNQMIDSLLQVIQDLQNQLNALQGGNRLETRVFELPQIEFTNGMEYNLDLFDITGYELDFAYIKFGKVVSVNWDELNVPDIQIYLGSSFTNENGYINWRYWGIQLYNSGLVNYLESGMGIGVYDGTNSNRLTFYNNTNNGSIVLKLFITAQFPN